MTLTSFRNHSHIKASIVIMKADNCDIHNYIISLPNIILKSMLMTRMRIEPHHTTSISDVFDY